MAVKAWPVLFFLAATTIRIEAVRVDDDAAQQHIPIGCKKKTGTIDCENGIFGRPHECKLDGVKHCCKNECPKDGPHAAEPFEENTQTGTGSTHNGDPMNAEKHAAQVEKKAPDENAKEEAGEQAEGEDQKDADSTTMQPTNSGITQKRMMEAGELNYHKANCTHPGAPEKNDTDDGQAQKQDEKEEKPADQEQDEKEEKPADQDTAKATGQGAALQQLNDDAPDPEAVKEAKAAAGSKVDEADAAKKDDKDADAEGKNTSVTMHPFELNERLADIKKNHQGAWGKWADSYIPDEEILGKEAEEEVPADPEESEQLEIQKAKASGQMHPFEVKERLEAIKKDHKGPWNKWSAHMTQVKSDYKPRS